MALHLYRVVVRGVFDGLDDASRSRLREALGAHDIFDAAFTEAETLTYDHHLHAFNTRFAVRADGDPGSNLAEVERVALDRTVDLLAALGVRGTKHRAIVTDMADMWGSRQAPCQVAPADLIGAEVRSRPLRSRYLWVDRL